MISKRKINNKKKESTLEVLNINNFICEYILKMFSIVVVVVKI